MRANARRFSRLEAEVCPINNNRAAKYTIIMKLARPPRWEHEHGSELTLMMGDRTSDQNEDINEASGKRF